MKKILLVSFYFEPCTLTPSQRISYWAKNFHRLGYYPIVVTRAWTKDLKTHQDTKKALGAAVKVEKHPNYEVHYLPFKPGMLDGAYLQFGEGVLRPLFLLTKLLDVLLARFTLAFTSYANFLPYLKKIISEQRPEKMIISGEPFYLFRLGYSLHQTTHIPWIADYRDDWTTNELQMEKGGSRVRRWIARLESDYEKKWVGTSEAVVSVSEAYTSRISDFVGIRGLTVENGFEEGLLDRPSQSLGLEFTVVYSGTLYPSQDLSLIFEVLSLCIHRGNPFKLIFLGSAFDVKEKKRILDTLPTEIADWVEVTERLPREEAIVVLQKAHVLLGIAYGAMKGIPSSKLYEYLALGKPVLLCPTDGDLMEQILTDVGLGWFVASPEEGFSAIRSLQQLYNDKSYTTTLRANSMPRSLKYSRYHQMSRLAAYLQQKN